MAVDADTRSTRLMARGARLLHLSTMPNVILYSPHAGAAHSSANRPVAAHYSARTLEEMAASLAPYITVKVPHGR